MWCLREPRAWWSWRPAVQMNLLALTGLEDPVAPVTDPNGARSRRCPAEERRPNAARAPNRAARECQDVATTDGIFSVKPGSVRISVNCRVMAGGVWTQVAYEPEGTCDGPCADGALRNLAEPIGDDQRLLSALFPANIAPLYFRGHTKVQSSAPSRLR
jgi:hypothetical protein